MPPLKWTPHSLWDITRLHDFLVRESHQGAKRPVKSIRQGVKLLARFPEMGRPVEELPPEFREWVIEFGSGAYVALYRYDGIEVVILALRHGRETGY